MKKNAGKLLLAAAVMIALTGCGGKNGVDSGTNAPNGTNASSGTNAPGGTNAPSTPEGDSGKIVDDGVQSAESENNEIQANDIPEGAVKIGTVEELEKFAERVNGGESDLNAVLTADLDLSGKYGEGTEGWQGIDNYNGIFDGNGHVLSGFVMNFPDGNNIGFFRTCDEDSVIRNLEIRDAVYEIFFGGSIAGDMSGTMENCKSSAAIHGNQIGGIAGTGNLIKDCVFSGELGAMSSAGGICWNGYVVEDCRNEGTITSLEEKEIPDASAGGIAVELFDYAKNCVNAGVVDGGIGNAGGIVAGGCELISDCRNEGTVSAAIAGGIAGNCSGTVSNCENTGTVHGTGKEGYGAGITGGMSKEGQIVNCSSTGTVESTYYAAGILAATPGKGTQRIINCYSSGTIISTGDHSKACAAGISMGTVGECRNCYTNADIQSNKRLRAIRGGQSEEDGCYYINTIRQMESDGEKETPGALAAEAFTDGTLLQLLNDSAGGIEGELCGWKQGEYGPVLEWQ